MRRLFLLILFLFPLAGQASGLTVSLNPGKIEVEVAPGTEMKRSITVSNRSSVDLDVTVTLNDIVGSSNSNKAVEILATSTTPTFLDDNVVIGKQDQKFILPAGKSRVIPLTIRIPAGTKGGGQYAAVLFNMKPVGASGVNLSASLGALIFVRVPGPVFTEGLLKEFEVGTPKPKQPIPFNIIFENQGDIYLNPYGYVQVTNLFGREVAWRPIDPYFVLPHSLRAQALTVSAPLSIGWYKVTLHLNRGYNNVIDTKAVTIFVWSSWLNLVVVTVIIIVGWLILRR